MKRRLQLAVALALVACIVAIVYSPFVDLPLTDTRGHHVPVQSLHALPAASFVMPEMAQVVLVSPLAPTFVPAADMVTLSCSYLC